VIDTAGLRDTDDVVEKIGIERTWQAVERADVALVLVDGREGITGSVGAILARLPERLPRIFVFNRERHLDAIRRAGAHLDTAAVEWQQVEIFAEELRLAQNALSEITGEFTADDLLGVIFSRFCIGK